MGSTTSTPEPIITYNSDGQTVYNGSIYTGFASTAMIVEDYPWIIWFNNSKIGDNYLTRLILETTLWGFAACTIAFLSHIGGFAVVIDPLFPNSDLNR